MFKILVLLFIRNQGVVLNSICSTWAGVLQGSNLRPLLFLIYINDVSDIVLSDPKLSTDHK